MTAVAKQAGGGEIATLVTHPVTYPVTKDEIARIRAEYTPLAKLDATNPEHYDEIRVAIGKLRSARTAVEVRRKDLKAGALSYGRAVDGEAKELTTLLEAIEDPLQAMKDAVDGERERVKREAEKADLLALEAKIKADREAEEARVKAEQAAAAAKLAEERATFEAVRAKADAERSAEDARRAEEQAKLDAQRSEIEAAGRKLREEQEAAARVETERAARAKAEEDAKTAAARAAADAEQARVAAEQEAARIEAMRPDIEKLRAWATEIAAFAGDAPEVASFEAKDAALWGQARLAAISRAMEQFEPSATTSGFLDTSHQPPEPHIPKEKPPCST